MSALWSLTPERRATAAHIRHFIADAIERKECAQNLPAKWWKGASKMSQDMMTERLQKSVKQLARESLDYSRYRAFMRGAYAGWPGDKPAHDLWQGLSDGTPVRFYSSKAGEYLERVGGAA
ncbi:hypothetical protein [Sphingomonas sp. TREG-RG-20F-R18-01]|uniref:hypothetical protein n=1 Tax=Sphingomonas sp. TREG-RG-20F-R18-01 TaxID=2914982 RepID=UPI001F563F0E|nr:hypothetical protein [Sphingomonas sp. TREG-RG-20F-R18-01]